MKLLDEMPVKGFSAFAELLLQRYGQNTRGDSQTRNRYCQHTE